MNSILSLTLGIFSAFFPQTHNPDLADDQTYTCQALEWPAPAAMGDDGHLRGEAQVKCDFKGLSGGGYPELRSYLLAQLKKEATQVHSGPVSGVYEALPSVTYDFDMNLTFSGKTVVAHEDGTLATDDKTRLVSLMNTQSISGSDYDDYVKAIDLTLDVTPNVSSHGSYHASISVSIDMTKPWYAPTDVFQTDVVNEIQSAVKNYQDTLVTEVQNNL